MWIGPWEFLLLVVVPWSVSIFRLSRMTSMEPRTKFVWAVAITVFPIVGPVAFWLASRHRESAA